MDIVVGRSNIKGTHYSIGRHKVLLTKSQHRVIVGLLYSCPCVRFLPIQDKITAKRLVGRGLASYRGKRPFEDGIRGVETKYVTLTPLGEMLAKFIKQEEKKQWHSDPKKLAINFRNK